MNEQISSEKIDIINEISVRRNISKFILYLHLIGRQELPKFITINLDKDGLYDED